MENLKYEMFLKANTNLGESSYYYLTDSSNFKYVPGSPFAYWVSDALLKVFEKSSDVYSIATPKQGMSTCDVNRFVKLWFEVAVNRTNILQDENHAHWVKYNKGGEYRKWYGNQEYVVYWGENGAELRKNKAALRNQDSYFDDFIAWTKLSSSSTAFRIFDSNFLFDGAGGSLFLNDKNNKLYLLGYLNTKVVAEILKVISPTLNYNESHIGEIPIIIDEQIFDQVNQLAKSCIDISRNDWDNFEISWDFKKHLLI